MPTKTNTPPQEPILEVWRIVALALIIAAGMLFVHLIVPTEADAFPSSAGAAITAR
jgi:hypothetical protein